MSAARTGAALLESTSICLARPDELAAIRGCLEVAKLPSNDIGVAHLRHFLVAHALPAIDRIAAEALTGGARPVSAASDENPPRGGAMLGVVGLESDGSVGLLRSLCVAAAHRGAGIGDALVQAIEAHASKQGIAQLFLLTTTAEHFFARRGYAVIPRGDAPRALQATREFVALCPASAVCMQKSIQV
jgi:N-acetylglutamate synthase-like GNAT family acetyltransferase